MSIYVERLANGSEWWCWSGLKLQYCKGCDLKTIETGTYQKFETGAYQIWYYKLSFYFPLSYQQPAGKENILEGIQIVPACKNTQWRLNRISGPMLNPVPKAIHFMDYLNFGALFDFFIWSICWNLCNLALVICLVILSWPNFYKSNFFW